MKKLYNKTAKAWETYDDEGKFHSFNDKPAIKWDDGTQWWFKHGLAHRDGDKPAKIWIINKIEKNIFGMCMKWFKDGKLHRDNGPAITSPEYADRYYKHGVKQNDI